MPQILILTSHRAKFSDLAQVLSAEAQCHVRWAESVSAARLAVCEARVDLMIIDDAIDGQSGFDIAREIITLDAMINLALVSPLSDEDFHEAAEGLGIMAHLPTTPGQAEAKKLIADLHSLSALKPSH